MPVDLLAQTLSRFNAASDVPAAHTADVFDAIAGCTDKGVLMQFLSAWNEKGFTAEELFNFASVMRGRMRRVHTSRSPITDIVGTGGAKAKTFNVSTAAAIIAAGAGITIAKHGNRAATSRTGSADAIAELGIQIEASPATLESRLDRDGICFLFAPNHHSLSSTLAAARRELGEPTIFNCLGPICNPASPEHSVIGVSRPEWINPVAEALARLGTKHSWVVHGECGLDEVAVVGRTLVAEIDGVGSVQKFVIDRSDFGVLETVSAVRAAADAAESARTIVAVIEGSSRGEASECISLLNAAATIFVAGSANSLRQSFEMATESIRNGSAAEKLRALREEI